MVEEDGRPYSSSVEHRGHVDKLAFTAVAAPATTNADAVESSGTPSEPLDVLRDQDVYGADGPLATNKEIYSYYAYYAGNNGIGSFQ
jgi:hypothetical protein